MARQIFVASAEGRGAGRMNFTPIEGWGKLPEGWHFVEVAGVAVDSEDRVFCFTRGEHPVIVFDRDGRFLRSWGEGLVRRAHAITIDADEMVWLTDDLQHTVRKFTPEGKLLLTIGDPDKPAALQGGKPFNRPTHVAICPSTGYLYISDGYGNSRVHKYTPDGRHVMSWGEPGTDPGQFNLPHNLAADAGGLVYVADRENHRVQIFDGHGRYQGQWNHLHRPCGLYPDRRDNDHFYIGELGTSLAVNANTPNLGPRVTVLNNKGERVCRFGGQFAGEGPGEFIAPHALVTDSRGDVYVAEVSYTTRGQHEQPPRELRSLQKFKRMV